jgi:hypothetical protein
MAYSVGTMVSTAGGTGVTEVDSPNFTAIAGERNQVAILKL